MLRITMNKSASAAKKYYSEEYYSEGKITQDYYSEKDKSIGIWKGKAAASLGLVGEINKNDFASLCDNLNPQTKEQLTERNNAARRVGYDFTFNASKSVSLAYTFGNEKEKKEILQAFRDSVNETMCEIETGMQARVRKSGMFENRETGNIAYGEFIHFTSRPVDGMPDPHLHAHCFVFNATYDTTEQVWKAGEFAQIKKDASYYEALFHASFADKLQQSGYATERTKNGFEIKGIDRDTIEKFSRRTQEIELHAETNNISDKKEKSNLGAQTRENKRNAATADAQISDWQNRLTADEQQAFVNLKKIAVADEKKKEDHSIADQAVQYALDHHLERKSVATDKEVLTTAIKSSLGDAKPGRIKEFFKQYADIIAVKENNQTFITTKNALKEENELIAKAYASKGNFKAINENYTANEALSSEQKNAITQALSTTDGIIVIAGKAGTGKTTLMKEVQHGIECSGKKLYAFAPSAEASRMVQRKEGFANAETVAALIQNKAMHHELNNTVIWIDEAGLLSNKDMNKVLAIAMQRNARVILTGDTKQHNSVERGDALRTLQKEAGITSIQVNKIQRQKNKAYKEAVQDLSKADVEKGFKKLEKIGAIHEIANTDERIQRIAEEYYYTSQKKEKKKETEVLVVSPTHAEGDKVTDKIRDVLKQQNVISEEDRRFTVFKNLQLTAAEKQKAENYRGGKWLIFHQNCKGFKAGSKYEITGVSDKNNIQLKDAAGKLGFIDVDKSANYHLYESKQLSVSKGDRIRITGNGTGNDGKHLFNGTMYKIEGFDKGGNIRLSNGSVLSKNYGHFTAGYVVTSYASQGKTVDKVIISQSSMSFRASSREQFYVSVSRGRQAVSIYTDDKTELLHAVKQSNERRSAIELTKQKMILGKAVEINRNSVLQRIKEKANNAVEKIKTSFTSKNMSNEFSR